MNVPRLPQQVFLVERREGFWATLRRLFSGKRGIEWYLLWDGSDEGLYESAGALLAAVSSRRRAMATLGFLVDLEVFWEPRTQEGHLVAETWGKRLSAPV